MGKIDYSKIDLKKLGKIGKTASGTDFEVKKWDEMEEGEEFIQEMLLVGVKRVNTQYGESKLYQFQDPKNLEDKRAVWGNKILNDAYDAGDLFEAEFMLYTITFEGKRPVPNSKNSYSMLEIMCYDLRKLGFEGSEEAQEEEVIEDIEEEEEEEIEEVVEKAPVRKSSVRGSTTASKAKVKTASTPAMRPQARRPQVKKSNKSIEDIVDDLI